MSSARAEQPRAFPLSAATHCAWDSEVLGTAAVVPGELLTDSGIFSIEQPPCRLCTRMGKHRLVSPKAKFLILCMSLCSKVPIIQPLRARWFQAAIMGTSLITAREQAPSEEKTVQNTATLVDI